MKRALIAVLAGVMLVVTLGCFAGCDASTGTLYSLEEVYEAQEIGKDDLLNIAYHNGNQAENESLMQGFTPEPIGELSEEISLKIRQCVAERYRSDGMTEVTAEDITIRKYLGCYNGYYMVRYSDALGDYPEAVYPDEVGGRYTQTVDDVIYKYGYSGPIRAWKSN